MLGVVHYNIRPLSNQNLINNTVKQKNLSYTSKSCISSSAA